MDGRSIRSLAELIALRGRGQAQAQVQFAPWDEGGWHYGPARRLLGSWGHRGVAGRLWRRGQYTLRRLRGNNCEATVESKRTVDSLDSNGTASSLTPSSGVSPARAFTGASNFLPSNLLTDTSSEGPCAPPPASSPPKDVLPRHYARVAFSPSPVTPIPDR